MNALIGYFLIFLSWILYGISLVLLIPVILQAIPILLAAVVAFVLLVIATSVTYLSNLIGQRGKQHVATSLIPVTAAVGESQPAPKESRPVGRVKSPKGPQFDFTVIGTN